MSDKFLSDGDDFFNVSSCAVCVHKSLDGATCDAFPNGIPDVILTGDVSHTSPYDGDNDIQFKRIIE